MQTASITRAIVEDIKGNVKSQYSETTRICLTVKKLDGNIDEIWGYSTTALRLYKKGDTIEYTKNGKELILFNEPQNAKNTEGAHRSDTQPMNAKNHNAALGERLKWKEPEKDLKIDMMDYINFQAKLYLHTFRSVSDEMKDMGLKDSEIKDISTTIFIQTQRKFSF